MANDRRKKQTAIHNLTNNDSTDSQGGKDSQEVMESIAEQFTTSLCTDGAKPAAGKSSLELIREAADQHLAQIYRPAMAKVAGHARQGNLPSLRLLLALVENKKPRSLPAKRARMRNLALRLKTELELEDRKLEQQLRPSSGGEPAVSLADEE